MTTKDGIKLHSWMMWPKGWSKQKRRSRPLVLFFQARSQGHLLAWPAAHAVRTVIPLPAMCSRLCLQYAVALLTTTAVDCRKMLGTCLIGFHS